MAAGSIDDAAARGFAANADGYGRGRPDYPVALDPWLRDEVLLGPDRTAVDLGAGTGKFVPRLRATGAAVVAVEPVGEMRARLAAGYPDVDVRAGTADAIPLGDASVDAVVCAQSFHWFATSAAIGEIARVLRPGGVLALVWNVRDESVAWVRRLTALVTPYEGTTPRFHTGDWRRVFPAVGFGPLAGSRFAHAHVGSAEHVIVDRFMSVSFIAALPVTARDTFESELRALIAGEPSLAGQATVTFPYETIALRSIRLQ